MSEKYVKDCRYIMYNMYMKVYQVKYHPDAKKTLAKIRRGDRKMAILIADAIDALSVNPRPDGCTQLTGDQFRIRKGGYRILYVVKDDVLLVLVLVIDRRGEVYGRKNKGKLKGWE